MGTVPLAPMCISQDVKLVLQVNFLSMLVEFEQTAILKKARMAFYLSAFNKQLRDLTQLNLLGEMSGLHGSWSNQPYFLFKADVLKSSLTTVKIDHFHSKHFDLQGKHSWYCFHLGSLRVCHYCQMCFWRHLLQHHRGHFEKQHECLYVSL